MEERLYRGKDKYSGAWIEGYYCPCCFGYFPCSPAIIEKQEMDAGCWKPTAVIPETIGQDTGRIDRNFKRIFEGDIVTGLFLFGLSVNAVVTFQNGAFGLEWYRGGDLRAFNAFTSICNVEYEVIGNIHDNPELLEAARNDCI